MQENSLNLPEFYQDVRKVTFLDFLSTPKQERGKTQKEFANEIQVSEQTLCEWKKDKDFQNELINQVRSNAVPHAPEILNAIAQKAKQGDAYAAKLWFQFVLGWSEKLRQDVLSRTDVHYVITMGDDDS